MQVASSGTIQAQHVVVQSQRAGDFHSLSLRGSEYEVEDVPVFRFDFIVRNSHLLPAFQTPKKQKQVKAALKAADRETDGEKEVPPVVGVVVGTA